MSDKSVGDLLREMEHTNVLTLRVHGFSTDALRASKDKVAHIGALALEEVTETPRGLLPLLAAVLDAADAMEAQHPHAQRPFDHDVFGVAAYRVARAALAEALKEGR